MLFRSVMSPVPKRIPNRFKTGITDGSLSIIELRFVSALTNDIITFQVFVLFFIIARIVLFSVITISTGTSWLSVSIMSSIT